MRLRDIGFARLEGHGRGAHWVLSNGSLETPLSRIG